MEDICVGFYNKHLVHGTNSKARVMWLGYRAERGGLAASSKSE